MATEINSNTSPIINEKIEENIEDDFQSVNMDSKEEEESAGEIETDDFFMDDDIDKNDCDIMCTVGEPEKQVQTMESFITYGIKTLTSRADYPGPEFNVRRRYNDFEWLRGKLEIDYPSSIIPPIPEKHVIKGVIDRFEPEFIKTRMSALEQFLARISQDVQLSRSEHFKNFLTLKSFEFNAQKSEKLISKIGKNIKNGLIGTPVNIPTRWEDEQLYTERMNDRLTKIERINERIMTEMTSYKDELNQLSTELKQWNKEEDQQKSNDLVESLENMAVASEKTSKCLTDMLKSTKNKVFPVVREMNKYNVSVMQLLRRRNNFNYEVEKVSETLSLKRCDLENLKLNNSFSMINLFSSDPDRARAEKSAHLEFEISRLEEREIALKEKLKSMEDQIEENLKSYHSMRVRQLAWAFHSFAQSNAHFHDMASSAWSGAAGEQFQRVFQQNKLSSNMEDLPL